MLRRVYDWIIGLAGDRRAIWWLAGIAFIEASVFPIPPDVLLIAMVLADRDKAWRYALVATLASVAGGWLGYFIGWGLYEELGRPVINFYHLQAGFEKFRAGFNEWGGWIVLIKGLTPIPYKLVTIAAGVSRLNPLTFTVASLGSRALRFFLVAALLRRFGVPIRDFIERRLVWVTSIFAIFLVAGFLILKFV